MAVNRYDTPARSEFINTYVPIPFGEMVAAGQVQQQRYDQASSALDQKIAALDAVQAIPDSVDEDYVSQLRSSLQGTVDEFSGKDLANPIVRRQLNTKIRQGIDPNRLRDIQNSFQGYTARNKGMAQLRARGQYNELLEGRRDPALQRPYDSREGTYQYLPGAYEDPTLGLRKLFSSPHYMAGRELGPKGGFHYSGRNEEDFEKTLDAVWQDFQGTIDGQNVVDQHLAVNPNSQLTDEQIIKDWARSKKESFMFERRGPKVDTGGGAAVSARGVPQSVIELTGREQPYSESVRDVEKTRETVIEGEKDLVNLESQRANAEKSGDDKQVAYMDDVIAAKKADLEPYQNILERLEEEYAGPYRKTLDAVRGNITSRLNNAIMQPSDIAGDGRFGFDAPFSEEEGIEISERISGIIDDAVTSGKRYAGRQKFLGRGASGPINWGKEYIQKYGQEEFNKLRENLSPEVMTEIQRTVTFAATDDLYNDTIESLNKAIEADQRGVIAKGYSESSVLLPVADPETKTLKHWHTGSVVNADTYRVIGVLTESPEDFNVDIISSEDLSGKPKKRANLLEDLKNADEVVPISISESGGGTPWVQVRAYKANKDGTRERMPEAFKFKVNRSMAHAMARDFIAAGGPNAVDVAMRLTIPEISEEIDYTFRESNKPKTFSVGISPNQSINFVLSPDDGFYYIADPFGTQYGPYKNREQIKAAAYEMYLNNVDIGTSEE